MQKPETCPERGDVDPTRMSVKVGAHYPERSDDLPVCYRHRKHRIVVAGGVAFIAALVVFGSVAHRALTSTESARPLMVTPRSGSIEGDRLVFVDVEESAAAVGTASIACRFGEHAAGRGEYDATSARYICR